jgi:hypothetical protein
MGPGVIAEVKSDSLYVVQSSREQKVMHHDKLKLCESGELPKWLINYQRGGTLGKRSPSLDGGSQAEGTSTTPRVDAVTRGEVGGSSSSGPHMGTRIKGRGILTTHPSKGLRIKHYFCVSNQTQKGRWFSVIGTGIGLTRHV